MKTLIENASKTILFTEEEIEDMIYQLEEEIEDIKSGDQDGVTKNMIQRRWNKIESLKGQNVIISKGDIILNLCDQTWTEKNCNNSLIFLTHRFKTGHFLGFWSHSPCSTTQDQEKGWAVIDPDTLKICETRSYGNWSGEFKEWRKQMSNNFGKATILKDDCGEVKWKMLDT